MSQVPAMDDQQVQINQSIAQLDDQPNLGVDALGHSEEVETLSIDAMEVDVQVGFNKSSNLYIYCLQLFFYCCSRLLKLVEMKKSVQCRLTTLWNRQILE